MDKYPSTAELRPEIVKAIKEYGTGTFFSPDGRFRLVIEYGEAFGMYLVDFYYLYIWMHYSFSIPDSEVREVAA
ncbi:hypothetical protein DYU05_04060 [Mucilaginibacter terrenus]|uniref:Uncharacterized protein n=1 Tax=Mucilaginibacter terrenus TaxID=2482727 RepID=A0A3E2NVB0_9SPHI|nr:hypothetical protein [Mucilaginibacter terrenus]RFZ84790.1 hypothetical protein DYU05_04060 [Mucilaginibacter terrenus]